MPRKITVPLFAIVAGARPPWIRPGAGFTRPKRMGAGAALGRHGAEAFLGLALVASALVAEEPQKPPDSTTGRPISESVARLLDRLDEQRRRPCRKSDDEAVPCFPVSVEAEEPRFSVRESIEGYAPGKGQRPSRPASETVLRPPDPGRVVVPFVSFDPVCATKSVLKKLKGRNDTYYLYRFRDRTGTRPVLTDRQLDAKSYADRPDVAFELLGRFEGECAAVAAYRRAERTDEARPRGPPLRDGPEREPKP